MVAGHGGEVRGEVGVREGVELSPDLEDGAVNLPLRVPGEPSKSMCSTQCEAPVMPGHSFLEPTRYHTQTLTVGLVGSGASSTRNPFASVRDRSLGRWTPERDIEVAPALVAYNARPGRARGRGGRPPVRHNR